MSKQSMKTEPRGMRKVYALGVKRRIDLSLSENPLGSSPEISLVLQKSSFELNDYPTPNALKLKTAMALKVSCAKENIFVCNGSEAIINVLPKIFARPGDQVLIPALTFPMFSICSELAGLNVLLAPMTTGLAIDLDAMLAMITEQTKLIFICNPNNPTGSILTTAALTAFVRSVPKRIRIVVDEANIEFGGESVVELIHSQPNLIILRTFSKGYGLASARIGVAIADESIISRFEEENPIFPISGFSEELAVVALEDDTFILKTKLFMTKERSRISEALSKCGFTVFASEANNLFVKLPSTLAPHRFLSAMESADISLVNGSSFVGFDDSFFRVSPRSEKINSFFLETVAQLVKGLE